MIVHETTTRIRFRVLRAADLAYLRVALELVNGVRVVRPAPAARSLTVTYDGRTATRRAVVELMRAPPTTIAGSDLPIRSEETLPIEAPALAAAVAPLMPKPLRSVMALALVGGKIVSAWRMNADVAAATLDSIALAGTTLTGYPLTAITSLMLETVAERQRNATLRETDRLLAYLAPPGDGLHTIERTGRVVTLDVSDLENGDMLWLEAGTVVPADAMVIEGAAETVAPPLSSAPSTRVQPGARLLSGARIIAGRIQLRIERPASRSRNARLRDHVRHVLRTRDAPGPLTPDLQRLLAMPTTAAGLVLALTGDAGRTATMLQADPHLGVSLAQPIAREAALYATARHGALLSGLDTLDRLATATAFAFEDIGVLTESHWIVDRVWVHADGIGESEVRNWLARLAGYGDEWLPHITLNDDQVSEWRAHGTVLVVGKRVLHIGGAMKVARTWGLPLPEPDRRSLVRRLGIVENARLVATVHLGCRVRRGAASQIAALRATGVRRIAVFTEDPTAQPAQALLELGADAIVSSDRASQERWLDRAVQRGEKVALVHTGLRDLLPPGGLSLCPVESEAGAHGVLLGEPLPSLIAARQAAISVRRKLRTQFGRAVAMNAGLMIAAAMRWVPPIATTTIKHGIAFVLLNESARLAAVEVPARSTWSSPEYGMDNAVSTRNGGIDGS
jgi:E1-E2 ATPase